MSSRCQADRDTACAKAWSPGSWRSRVGVGGRQGAGARGRVGRGGPDGTGVGQVSSTQEGDRAWP